jgi:hypothetical protein
MLCVLLPIKNFLSRAMMSRPYLETTEIRVKKRQFDTQLILSIFRQPLHVSCVSRPIIRRYNRIYTTSGTVILFKWLIFVVPSDDGPRYARTCRGWRNILRISCASSCIKLVFPYSIVSRCGVTKHKMEIPRNFPTCWKSMAQFLKMIWIQPRLFNFKYKLVIYSTNFVILKFK